MDSHKKVLKIFSTLKILNSPFSKERDLWSFSSFLSFFSFFLYASFSPFFLCSVSLLRMNSGIFEMFEEKTICFQTFFQMGWKWLHKDL
jgi:hypothetical protein